MICSNAWVSTVGSSMSTLETEGIEKLSMSEGGSDCERSSDLGGTACCVVGAVAFGVDNGVRGEDGGDSGLGISGKSSCCVCSRLPGRGVG